jgi:hypothetical protein
MEDLLLGPVDCELAFDLDVHVVGKLESSEACFGAVMSKTLHYKHAKL